MLGLEGDSQPLGYALYSRRADAYRERADHPLSTPNPDEIARPAAALGRRGPGRAVHRRDHRQPRRRVLMAHDDDVLGNRSLTRFDVCVIGSGAGGGAAAHVLTAAGKSVLVLEAGPNPFPRLDARGPLKPTLHGNDELKYAVRNFITPFPDLEPRTFRMDAAHAAVVHPDVNVLPKCVGGAWSHADMKTPRFTAVDFQLVTAMQRAKDRNPGLEVPGFFADASSANFSDWPFPYEVLEPFVRRGGAADRRVGRRLESLRAAAVRAVSDARARGHVRREHPARRCEQDDVQRRSALAAQVPRRHRLALLSGRPARPRAPALQPVRPVQRLRLSQPREGIAGGDVASAGRCSPASASCASTATWRRCATTAAP